jgi:hypothetical protein
MARLVGSVDEVRTVRAGVKEAMAHFADAAQMRDATRDAQSITDVGGGVVAFVMNEQQHGPVKFRPEYQVRYWTEGEKLRWAPSGKGNLESTGEASFQALPGGGTRISFHQEIAFDLPVNGLIARMLQPVVSQAVAPGVRDYLDRMVLQLDRG